MTDIDSSRHVSEIPQGQPLSTYERRIQPNVSEFSNVQNAISNYANNNNFLSIVGSTVAASASNAIAKKLGSELGMNPKGNMIDVPLTDFDKAMQESYKTQAQATLGLQANKLISDSNLEASKADRITPELIAKTNKSISIGLQNIFKNAPSEIVPNLQYHYGTLQMNQAADLTERMIREQREDRRNNTALAVQSNAENAYSFGLRGNDEAAEDVIKTTKKLSEADVNSRLMTPEQAKANVDTARKSYLSGKIIHDYELAKAEGKGEDFLKSIAEKKPSYLSDSDYMGVTNNLLQYVNHQESLRSQDEQLRLAKFQTSIAMNPIAPDIGQQLQDLKNNVTPVEYERAKLHYVNSVKAFMQEQGETTDIIGSWKDPSAFARLPEKAINKGFDMLTEKYMEQRKQEGNSISAEEAEVQIAASAGGKVPVFLNTLKNKINSANPAMMDSAARQMDALYSMNAGHALVGISDHDKAIFTQYKSLRDSLPPEEAAKIAIQNSNQEPDIQRMNKEKWSEYLKLQTSGGFLRTKSTQEWALNQVGMNKKDFMNPGIANEYGNLILNKYAAFYQMTNGDKDSALKLTKQEVEENFGYTGVNGGKVKTLHPIEKVLGYPENSDVVPFIQQDVVNTLNKSFIPLKESFQKGESDVYWEVVSGDMKNHAYLFGHNYNPIQVKRYTKTKDGIKSDLYNVMLIGNSFNWDISLQTDAGMRPLPQIAPYLGIQTYTPNKKAIDTAYLKRGK